LSSRQIAIEFYCPTCETRDYKPVSDKDREKFDEIKKRYANEKEELLFPRDILPEGGSNITNLRNYGFSYFSELFNERQLISLSLLLEAITEVSDQNIQEYLLAAFSSSLEFHTVLCPYNYTMKQIVNIFNYQSYLIPTMYVENNVWGTKKGNGSFLTYLKKIKKGKSFCKSPFEIAIQEGKITRMPIKGDKIEAINVKNFQELLNSKDGSTLLIADSSENLQKLGILPESIDIVITDPPYFDFIQYSELANFFYVWLKLILKSKYLAFNSDLINTSQEIGSNKGEDIFLNRITSVFKQCNTVLKKEGPLVFTFHHSTPKIWAIILRAIIESGFNLTAAFPIHSEFKARPVKGRNSDIILVCRKDSDIFSKGPTSSWNYLKSELDSKINTESLAIESDKKLLPREKILAEILPQVVKVLKENPSLDLQVILNKIFTLLNKPY
jgi:adenine-specific DNA methylase